ncbi:hypothetical protein LOTGIDRAFT_158292 [Lottia gigantea]|uniref:Farnesoic acid O-methyl transferase domain-containing protein n=1 Tax=Lottia gigantea TaxID=225164 RepID=V4CDP6_LOTGI|nr:hypothetical protein LOTGIDRAFT_158292 [Lottia gigantea]ESP00060.1 hypothetical protein LOTGIDRAFT_158292 [Lottia gigantea]
MIWIKGGNDGVIGLFNETHPNNFVYEIIIGGGGNTWTGAKSKAGFKAITNDNNFMLEPERFKAFWLTWSEASLDVVFGVGNQIGSGQTIRFNRDPTFTLKYLALYDGFVPFFQSIQPLKELLWELALLGELFAVTAVTLAVTSSTVRTHVNPDLYLVPYTITI